jgi:hypothetical protein
MACRRCAPRCWRSPRSGCARRLRDAGDSGHPRTVVLSLDFSPRAVHAPINMGVRKGRDRDAGARLEIRELAGGPDAVRLVASGRVDLGVLDVHDLASARQQGTDLVAVGALVGRLWLAAASRRLTLVLRRGWNRARRGQDAARGGHAYA